MPAYESRRRLKARIIQALRIERPLIRSELVAATRSNEETVKTAVKHMVRRGELMVLPEPRPTRWGPAKQFDLPPVATVDPGWCGSAPAPDERTRQIQELLMRWATWTCTKSADVSPSDRALFWTLEAAVRALPVTQAIALLNVHGCAVWVFRRMDMAEAYRDALAIVARRLEPLMEGRKK